MVATLSGGAARLVDAIGQHVVMPLPELLADPALELVSGSRPSLCSEEALAGLPETAVERARWWERHIVEILTGRPPGSAPGTRPRPEFDPTRQSLRQRELAKLAELQAAGYELSRNALQRRRFAYERDGLLGVVDGRHNRRQPVFGRVDERVVAAVRDAIDGETDLSTGTVQRLQRRWLRRWWPSMAATMLRRCRRSRRFIGWSNAWLKAGTRLGRRGPAARCPSSPMARSGRSRWPARVK